MTAMKIKRSHLKLKSEHWQLHALSLSRWPLGPLLGMLPTFAHADKGEFALEMRTAAATAITSASRTWASLAPFRRAMLRICAQAGQDGFTLEVMLAAATR